LTDARRSFTLVLGKRTGKARPMEISSTVQNIIDQIMAIRGKGPGVSLLIVDEITLRVHRKRGRKVTNVDIRYEAGSDLYTVSMHTFSSPKYQYKTAIHEDVCADMLPDLIFPDRVVLHSS